MTMDGRAPRMMRLAVIIVSFNTCALLRDCLSSVLASAARTADRLDVVIWVVDNASGDGSAAMVAAEFPSVRLVALDRNVGFTGGNNHALTALGFAVMPAGDPNRAVAPAPTRPGFVLLLNPDTAVAGDALYTMAAFLRDHPAVGACGARLAYGDGAFQHGAFRFPSLAQVALDFFPPARLPGAQRLLDSRVNGRYARSLWDGGAPFAVDFVLGAAMLVRGAAIDAVGGLDDAYWMYCEEMDWCLRLREDGWQVFAVPQAQVVHYAGQSSRQVRWPAYVRLWQSRFRFYDVHRGYYPRGYRRALRWLVKLGLAAQRREMRGAFARGAITGQELADALDALHAVEQM